MSKYCVYCGQGLNPVAFLKELQMITCTQIGNSAFLYVQMKRFFDGNVPAFSVCVELTSKK